MFSYTWLPDNNVQTSMHATQNSNTIGTINVFVNSHFCNIELDHFSMINVGVLQMGRFSSHEKASHAVPKDKVLPAQIDIMVVRFLDPKVGNARCESNSANG